jgi:hypothetical protein
LLLLILYSFSSSIFHCCVIVHIILLGHSIIVKALRQKFFYGIRSSALSPTLNQWDRESRFWGTLPLEDLSLLRLSEPSPPFAVYKPYQCPSFPPCSTQLTFLTYVFGSTLVQEKLLMKLSIMGLKLNLILYIHQTPLMKNAYIVNFK